MGLSPGAVYDASRNKKALERKQKESMARNEDDIEYEADY